ncbi:HNH endonuclease [Halorussus halophilus]|uniref:HNH endonuclease n=1 Tax=Halorussus halophilus TaxID=2650975 RepID=UPI0013019447|nr:HNH endonuclease signature motif containing protein [Halorussus halophilus]
MTTHVCPTCERGFETEQNLKIHFSERHGGQLLTQECDYCTNEFYVDYAKRFCSRSCCRKSDFQSGTTTSNDKRRKTTRTHSGTTNSNYRRGKTTGTCKICESEFEYYSSSKRGLYCPDCVQNESWQTPPEIVGEKNPRWNGGKQIVECDVCGDTVERYPSNIGDTTVCSEPCRKTWLSEAFTGSGHPNWNGGGNGAYGTGWNETRKKARKRDEDECVVCGITREELGRHPDVHHIIPVRWFIDSDHHTREDAHFLDNVACLCPSCHRKAEFEKIPPEKLRTLIEK